MWQKHLVKVLVDQFKRSQLKSDACVFNNQSVTMSVLNYVDGLLIIGEESVVNAFITNISKVFKFKHTTHITNGLGFTFLAESWGWFAHRLKSRKPSNKSRLLFAFSKRGMLVACRVITHTFRHVRRCEGATIGSGCSTDVSHASLALELMMPSRDEIDDIGQNQGDDYDV
eukprot:4065674-Amphidinium_carterae.1